MAIDKFGTAAVRSAWYDPKQVSEHVLSGYTRVISCDFSFSYFCLFCSVILEFLVLTWLLAINTAFKG